MFERQRERGHEKKGQCFFTTPEIGTTFNRTHRRHSEQCYHTLTVLKGGPTENIPQGAQYKEGTQAKETDGVGPSAPTPV